VTRGRENEVNRGRVEVDVEAIFDTLEDLLLGDFVIACVDNTGGFRPAFLDRADRCP
jgi:hypothetical protein